mmetsp:Transcript_44100/g.134281  ORF Transcript_44100/g.134281 Transcript_44100/m.134281 type:complete len:274 (+) Transcript_44100:197-1018(+)
MHDMPDHDEEAGISANFDGRTRTEEEPSRQDIAKVGVYKEISKEVLRKKLVKMRHLVIKQGIQPRYLDALFPSILEGFEPQVVNYNGGRANIKEWKISCYLEVMSGGVPCTNPNIELKSVCQDLLDTCNLLFAEWYRQQHACNRNGHSDSRPTVERLMTFITRYTPAPGEQALLKASGFSLVFVTISLCMLCSPPYFVFRLSYFLSQHVDGAGKVDGSVVVALPIDRWSAPGDVNSFEGYGGGLTFWDGKTETGQPKVLDYDTRSGDIAFIDR